MITIKESNHIISQVQPFAETEQLELTESLGRILAKTVVADTDQPLFNKSAMDGYACKREDLHEPMKIIGTIAAGSLADELIQQGECFRIFTGAPVPKGADCVIMQENTSIDEDGNVRFIGEHTKNNICDKGEDCKTGDTVISAGTRIEAQHLAIMAANGIVNPTVYTKVHVSLYCSGSELIEPNQKPTGAMIRNSNASQLLGQLQQVSAVTDYKGIIPDELNLVSQKLKSEIGKTDVVIITGGASVGDFDFIPTVLREIGAEIKVSSLNIQPGKPVLLAQLKNTYIFGLSGNPVSSFLQFKVFAEPMLLKLMGANSYLPKIIRVPLSTEISRKKGNRQFYIPVKINSQGHAEKIIFNGSAHINALNTAQGFVIMKPGTNQLKANEIVPMMLI